METLKYPLDHKRKLRNFLVTPAGRMRVVFGLPVVGLLMVGILLQTLKYVMNTQLERAQRLQGMSADTMRGFQDLVTGSLNMGIGLTLVCALLVAVFGVLLGHHYYGPVVPIVRTLREFGSGNFSSRIRLRTDDELREIMEAVNTLGDKLEQENQNRS